MYTYSEAQKLAQYYRDKVMGKPLDGKSDKLPIQRLEIDLAEGGGYNVYCHAKATPPAVFYSAIQNVASALDLLPPEEALEEIKSKE